MIVTAWNNGEHSATGAGYGLKIKVADRDKYFHREWKSVILFLEGQDQPVVVNVAKKFFWTKTCRELISAEVGRWLIQNGFIPWLEGNPPKMILKPLTDPRHFRLMRG
jgi:hypothetical protein